MVLLSIWTLLCGVYRPCGLVLCHQLCNRSQRVSCFHVRCLDQSGVAYILQFVSSQLRTARQRACRPKIAAPGEAFSTMWYVERIAHAALTMKVSMSAGLIDSAMSISEVRIIVPRT